MKGPEFAFRREDGESEVTLLNFVDGRIALINNGHQETFTRGGEL